LEGNKYYHRAAAALLRQENCFLFWTIAADIGRFSLRNAEDDKALRAL
jgi:hypothetical protein